MSQPTVNFAVTDGNLGRRNPSADNVCALITTGVAADELDLDEVSGELKSIDDVEALGIDADYDSTNKVLVYHHLREFFKHNPDGSVYLLIKSQATTLTQLADKTTSGGLKGFLQSLNGKVKQVGICINPADDYEATLTGGLDGDVITAIAKAQELAAEEFAEFRPVFILLEGRSVNGTISEITDLRTQQAPFVGVTIVQDKDVADALATAASNTDLAGYADVGAVLGLISLSKVSESISWPEKFRLDYDGVNWVNPGISSNDAISMISNTNLNTLNDRGYIAPRVFSGVDGVYIQNNPVCEVATSDFAFINDRRTINKAVSVAYSTLVVKLNSPLKVDATTGKLASEVVKYFEQLIKGALEVEMVRKDEASGVDAYIDPNQNVLESSTLTAKISVVPIGAARAIDVEIGFAASV